MMRIARLLALAVLAVAAPAAAQEAGPGREAPAGLAIVSVDRAEGPGGEVRFAVSGTAELPDGAWVRVLLTYREQLALYATVQVASGRIEVHLGSTESRLLPGEYTVTVAYDPADQEAATLEEVPAGRAPVPAQATFAVGAPEAWDAEHEAVRARLVTVYENLQRLYEQMGQWSSFAISSAILLPFEHEGRPPEPAARRVLNGYLRFAREQWEPSYATVKFDYEAFRRGIFLTPYPAADEALGTIFQQMDLWNSATVVEICKGLGLEVPSGVRDPGPFTANQVREKVQDLAEVAALGLALEGEPWKLIDENLIEKGLIEGDHYRSLSAKFEVTKPPTWEFARAQFDPTVRLRILPPTKAEDVQVAAAMGVELEDFPTADHFEDLAIQLKARISQRWPGYKKVRQRDLQVDDPSIDAEFAAANGLTEGKRPGVDTVFDTTGEEGTYRIRHYALFCRWHKRAYSLLCMAPKDAFKTYEEKEFQETPASFHVLDDPKMHEGD